MNMQNCTLCPRNCHADRTRGYGFCRAGKEAEIALVSLHRWEEPCLSGQNGAGTVFFSHCSMQCIFCQNHEISTEGKGIKVSIERLAQIFLEQQQRNAHCLELVTPTHYVPQIIQALDITKQKGLNIPVVYNCGGYEKTETLEKTARLCRRFFCPTSNITIAKRRKNIPMLKIIRKLPKKPSPKCTNL